MNKYKRILLKLSGEALAKNGNTVDPNTLSQVVDIIKSVLKQKVEVGIVVGGGNIFRGAALVVKHGEPVPAEKITTFPMLSACFALL
jgi:uridylate kinase